MYLKDAERKFAVQAMIRLLLLSSDVIQAGSTLSVQTLSFESITVYMYIEMRKSENISIIVEKKHVGKDILVYM